MVVNTYEDIVKQWTDHFYIRNRALPAHNIIGAIKIVVASNPYSKCSQFTLLQAAYHHQNAENPQFHLSHPVVKLNLWNKGGGAGPAILVARIGSVVDREPRSVSFFWSQIRCTRPLFVKHAPGDTLDTGCHHCAEWSCKI